MLAGPKGQNRQPPLRFKRQCTECTAWKLTLSWSLLRTVRECMRASVRPELKSYHQVYYDWVCLQTLRNHRPTYQQKLSTLFHKIGDVFLSGELRAGIVWPTARPWEMAEPWSGAPSGAAYSGENALCCPCRAGPHYGGPGGPGWRDRYIAVFVKPGAKPSKQLPATVSATVLGSNLNRSDFTAFLFSSTLLFSLE